MSNLSWCAKVTMSASCQHPPLLLHHCILPPDRIRALTPVQNMKYVQCYCVDKIQCNDDIDKESPVHGAGQREWVRTVALRRASAEPEGDHVST